jgi:hypothetical protein
MNASQAQKPSRRRQHGAARREALEYFYRERVPEQLNGALAAQRRLASQDAEAARILEEMQAVRSSIVVEIEEDGGLERFVYDIEGGEARLVDTPGRAAFLSLRHTSEDFEALRRECGDSLLGFLGSLVGLGDELRLTAGLVRRLHELEGVLTLDRSGADGFRLKACFGRDTAEPTARATIRIDEANWRALRSGDLDPQEAFWSERIEVTGDEGLAIGLALAAMAPA